MIIRSASLLDARDIAELLHETGKNSQTGSKRTPLSTDEIKAWIPMAASDGCIHVAENESGALLGFQLIEPLETAERAICDIATFVRDTTSRLHVGSALFEMTKQQARALHFTAISASVPNLNQWGIAYYQSRGFERWSQDADRIVLRYDLR